MRGPEGMPKPEPQKPKREAPIYRPRELRKPKETPKKVEEQMVELSEADLEPVVDAPESVGGKAWSKKGETVEIPAEAIDLSPDEALEMPPDDEEVGEKTEKVMVAAAEAGSQGEVEATVSTPEMRAWSEKQNIARETGKTLLQKKLEAGADLGVLKENLQNQLEEINMTVEELEEAGDQPVMLEDEKLKREKVLAGLEEVARIEKAGQEAAA